LANLAKIYGGFGFIILSLTIMLLIPDQSVIASEAKQSQIAFNQQIASVLFRCTSTPSQ